MNLTTGSDGPPNDKEEMQRDNKKNKDRGPRFNRQIRADPVRVIDDDGTQLGVIALEEAGRIARSKGLDLVEVQPNSRPPVCKIIDYGKFKYEQKKKANEVKKNQKKVELKEIKFRPKTDTHDFDVKTDKIRKFIEDGNRVKVTVMFRGREMLHPLIGKEILLKVKGLLSKEAVVDSFPKMEGRNMFMTLAPTKKGEADGENSNKS